MSHYCCKKCDQKYEDCSYKSDHVPQTDEEFKSMVSDYFEKPKMSMSMYASEKDYWEAKYKVLEEALTDMLNGWIYLRESHGDLYGVGWDRAQQKAEKALGRKPHDTNESST